MAETEERPVPELRTPEVHETVNPPYVVPYGHADAAPSVPVEPTPDPETQAYIDAHVASPDPRDPDQDPAIPPETYHAGFVKPADPRDTGTEDPAPGDLIPPAPGPEAGAATTPPVNVDVPHLSQDGATLNCTMGNWEGEPDQYAYLWLCDGLEVGTGTEVHTLVPDDVGHDFTCVVTASNAAGSATAPASNSVTVVDPAAREGDEHKSGHRNRRSRD